MSRPGNNHVDLFQFLCLCASFSHHWCVLCVYMLMVCRRSFVTLPRRVAARSKWLDVIHANCQLAQSITCERTHKSMHTLAATETHGYISNTVEIRSRVYYVELVILALIEWTNASGALFIFCPHPQCSQPAECLAFVHFRPRLDNDYFLNFFSVKQTTYSRQPYSDQRQNGSLFEMPYQMSNAEKRCLLWD